MAKHSQGCTVLHNIIHVLHHRSTVMYVNLVTTQCLVFSPGQEQA